MPKQIIELVADHQAMSPPEVGQLMMPIGPPMGIVPSDARTRSCVGAGGEGCTGFGGTSDMGAGGEAVGEASV